MRAPLNNFGRRGVAVLTSGVVISLTALTAGLAPAVAKPGSDDDVVTTTVAPEPKVSAPEPEQTPAEQPTAAVPVAPEAPASQPATQVAPQPQVPAAVEPEPQAPATVEPEPQTQAPEPQTQAPAPKTSTAVQTAESSAEPSTTVQRTPTTTPSPGTTTAAPATSGTAVKSDEAATSAPASSATSAPASESAAPATDSKTPAASSSPTSASATTAPGEKTRDSDTPTVSIAQAAKEIETLAPETLEAPKQDVELARSAKPVFEPQPAVAPQKDVEAFKSSIDKTLGLNGAKASASTRAEIDAKRNRDFELVSNVRQWRPDWIQYDEFYRPVILNPFHAPVRIVYMYERAPRITVIPPLARMVIEAAQFAAYSFTAAVLAPVAMAAGAANAVIDAAQAVTNIAVGSFFGGGFFPGVGMPLPPPPPPVLRYDNVPVFVNYSNARYEPFRVRQIIDVGDDRQYGERKVLLDGATPAWGQWTQTASGERQFEVHRTQQFPGLDAPQEGPLPGDYRLRLASDQASTDGLTGRDIFLMVSAGVIGTLGFGAIGLAFFLGRRRPEHQ